MTRGAEIGLVPGEESGDSGLFTRRRDPEPEPSFTGLLEFVYLLLMFRYEAAILTLRLLDAGEVAASMFRVEQKRLEVQTPKAAVGFDKQVCGSGRGWRKRHNEQINSFIVILQR